MDHDYQVYMPGSLEERVADAILVADTDSPTWRGDLRKSITAMLVDSSLYTNGVVDSETASDDTQSAAPPPPAGSDGWREAVAEALAGPLLRLAAIERDGMPEGMDPLSNDDGLSVRVGELRAVRDILAPTPPVAPRG